MKKIILTVFCCLVAVTVMQAAKPIPAKYAAGAVPEKNGKVVFERSFGIGSNADAAYAMVEAWAGGRFAKPVVISGKVNSSAASKETDAQVTEELIFKKGWLITDLSKISYSLNVTVNAGKCTMTVTDITYDYGDGEVFAAEDWITDKECYNASGTKFLRLTGKFRIKTIDLVDTLAAQLEEAVSKAK